MQQNDILWEDASQKGMNMEECMEILRDQDVWKTACWLLGESIWDLD